MDSGSIELSSSRERLPNLFFLQQAPTDNTDKKVVRVKIKSRPVVSNSIFSRNIDRFFLIPLSSFSIVLFHRDVYIYIESVQ